MNNIKKLILNIVTLSSILFSGCSSNTKVDQLSSDIQNLNTKVDYLSNSLEAIHSDIQIAKDDADRANQRLDNQATKYRK